MQDVLGRADTDRELSSLTFLDEYQEDEDDNDNANKCQCRARK